MNNSSILRPFRSISLKIKDDRNDEEKRPRRITMTFAVTKHPRRDATRSAKKVCPSVSFFMRYRTSILLYDVDHTPVQECNATFFISLWKREKCANQFLVVARRERLWKELKGETGVGSEGEFSRGSRVKLHLRDSYSLHVISCARSPRKRPTTSGDLHNN